MTKAKYQLRLEGEAATAGANVIDGDYNTTVSRINFGSGGFVSAYFDGKDSNGNTIGFLQAPDINSISEGAGNVNMATFLNYAYWTHQQFTVYIYEGKIAGVEAPKSAHESAHDIL